MSALYIGSVDCDVLEGSPEDPKSIEETEMSEQTKTHLEVGTVENPEEAEDVEVERLKNV